MKRIFLGGGNNSKSVSDSMGSVFFNDNNNSINNNNKNDNNHSHYSNGGKSELQFIEVWDYMGGASFRGFVADKVGRGRVEKTLFLFFESVEGTQLKHGLIALIELATECFNCDRLVIALDRKTDGIHGLIRDFGWVGFELITLSHWLPAPSIDNASRRSDSFSSNSSSGSGRSGSFSSIDSSYSSSSDDEITSDDWIFVGMEL
ncbi:ornithine decarboxylase antizyme-domain-containing protein [Morchella snyderi]|nr:ornithine decarboxylase antizyme-domain-containing protein [Morchella snyderi]